MIVHIQAVCIPKDLMARSWKIRIMEIRKGNKFTEAVTKVQGGQRSMPKCTLSREINRKWKEARLPEGSEKLSKMLRGRTIFIVSAPQGVFQPPKQTGTGYVTVCERGWDPVELPAHIGTQTCLKVIEIPYNGAVSTWTHRKGTGHIPSRWAYKSSSRRKRSLSWALRDERT